MKLFILRHGVAVERGTPGFEEAKRPLTSEGEKQARRAALAMERLGIEIDLILSSPILRARSTAEIVCERLELATRLRLSRTLEGDSNPADVIEEIRREHSAAEGLLLVGHEPHLSHLVSQLLTGTDACELRLRKGGLCLLRAKELENKKCASLEWLLTPKQLHAVARKKP